MRIKIFIVFIFATLTTNVYSQVLDPEWKKAVALIETKTDSVFSPVGTGVFVAYANFTFLVTNNHVAQNHNLYIRFNSISDKKPCVRLSIDSIIQFSKAPWYLTPSLDVAILPLFDYRKIKDRVDTMDVKPIGLSLFQAWSYVNEGDELYILGFPIGVGTTDKHYNPVYRFGIIALKEKKNEFLIDANIYPGSSGSPVFIKPSIYDYRNNSIGVETKPYLIGIVSSYLPYTDVAISAQTKRPRVTFEENSGLAVVYSTDVIIEALKQYDKILKNSK